MIGTVERCRGRWAEILPRLGIDSKFLVNRHGPCPLCDGKDRFRYDDRNSAGDYFCNQCGAGVGITLVCKLHKWDYGTACRAIDEIIGNEPPKVAPSKAAAKPTGARLSKIERVLNGATDPGVVRRYLASRGLRVVPPVLRGHRGLAYHDQGGKLLNYHPAIVAPIVGPDGRLQSAHRIYIGEVAPRKKTMTPVDTIKGGAVRLFDPVDSTLGVAEGIENAIAAHELFGIPTWAALTTSGIEAFEPPAGLCHVIVYADNDPNFAGQKAAYVLANRLVRTVPEVEVMVPPETDSDWLDVLNERRHRGVA